MHQKERITTKLSKAFISILVLTTLFSMQCLAANDSAVYGLSGFRCTNSTCGGAYLHDNPTATGQCSCGEALEGYICPVCSTRYDICKNGHYHFFN